MENYPVLSIETHLFFARIMKEHALFLEAGFPCKDKEWIEKADNFRQCFENLLCDVIKISNGFVNTNVLKSNEIVTRFTVPAEQKTEKLSGIPINTNISEMELQLCPGFPREMNRDYCRTVHQINIRAISLLDGLIAFKENLLNEVNNCRIFNSNYPLLIKHILREAKLYRSTISELMNNRRPSYKNIYETEQFWNRIMMEHALFIRGLLDPSEEELVATAQDFACDFKELLELAKHQDCRASSGLTQKSLNEALKIRDFKAAGAEGILNCNISSIILPLLADHVLREANHYIRILECSGSM